MHTQSRNPYRERDHRISLMPLGDPQANLGAPRGILIGCALSLPLWAAIVWWLV